MKKYSRMTLVVRCQIDAYLQAKFTIAEIAKATGYHKSSIYRELKRNFDWNTYIPGVAQKMAEARYSCCKKRYRIRGELENLICEKLELGWSPEQISGRLRREKQSGVSCQGIYNYIHAHKELKIYLRRKRKRGGGRYCQRKVFHREGMLKFNERPNIANRRRRIGDWERDSMQAKDRRQVIVCTERKSRLTKLDKVLKHTNELVNKTTIKLVNSTKRKAFTMTNDNGKEFKSNQSYGIKTFFCEPYKPQQRGTVENTIGLIRQYIKRDTDISQYCSQKFREIEELLNNRPRKVLDYKTPNEVYYGKKVALANLT